MVAVNQVVKGHGGERLFVPGDFVLAGENILAGAIATVGAGTWTGAAIATGIIRRTGPVAGYTDTTDTATNIMAAIGGNQINPVPIPGSTFRMLLLNTVAQALTFAAGTGVVAGTGTLNVAASLWREYLWTVLNTGPTFSLSCSITNASPTVLFNLPQQATSLPMGSTFGGVNVTPGMTVSGTGITAGTLVLGLTLGQGGILGVTLNANATATASSVLLTFGPTLQIDSLRSGTA